MGKRDPLAESHPLSCISRQIKIVRQKKKARKVGSVVIRSNELKSSSAAAQRGQREARKLASGREWCVGREEKGKGEKVGANMAAC